MADERFTVNDIYIPQSEMPPQEEAPQEPRKKHHPLLWGWLIWFVFTIATTVVLLPKVKASILKSGVVPLIMEHLGGTASSTSSDTRTVNPVFVIPGDTLQAQTFTPFAVRQQRTGQGVYHDTIEALLAGPTPDSIAAGAISYIQPGTSLIGLTESTGIIYVDLTATFLDSPNLEQAILQVKQSLTRLEGIRDVVIMINGKKSDL